MNVITKDSDEYKQIVEQLNRIEYLVNKKKNETPLKDFWIDNDQVCKLLKISKRTLQHYRDSRLVPFSQKGHKIYYKASDIDAFLESGYIEKK